MRLLIGEKFFDSFIKLPKRIQKKVVEFQNKFKENRKSAAINLESISTFKDQSLRTARIDQKYRAIIGTVSGREDYYLLWVDNHDEAMAWAENKTFEWNEITNAPQLYTVEVSEKEINNEPDWGALYGPRTTQKNEAISSLATDDLLNLGVPGKLIEEVHKIQSLADLEKIEKKVPEDIFEHLFYLLDGVPFDEVIGEIETAKEEEGGDSLAFKRFYIEVDDELLQRMLDGDLEKWSIFLHPSQRTLVNRDFKGSVKVTGGAGTGKTVAAVHRLKYLSEKTGAESGKVLFATYTNALKRNLNEQIKKLSIPEYAYELSTIDALANQLGVKFDILSSESTITGFQNTLSSKEIWEKVLEREVTEFDSDFLNEETQEIIFYHHIKDIKEYISQTRFGRGEPISRRKRLEVWKLFEKYQQYKQKNNIYDRLELFNVLSDFLTGHPDKRIFKYVVLDEVQDCSNVEIRFIRSLVEVGVNDLFLVGDPFQSIYSRKVVFSQCGVNIRGRRSRRLKVNYRTTEEIKRYALSVLDGVVFNDFDDEESNLNGYVSFFHGAVPTYSTFNTKEAEINFIKEKIEEFLNINDSIRLSDIVIATRTKDSYKELLSDFHKADLEYFDVKESVGNRSGIHLCTFHSLKGLEYKFVILADVNERTCPYLPFNYQNWSDMEKKEYEHSEKALLYTASTRAIFQLVISGVGEKSKYLL